MTAVVEEKRYSAEDLLTLPDGDRYELVGGRLVEKSIGAESAWVGLRLSSRLLEYCDRESLGWVFPADASYKCFSDDASKVRRPDVSFVGSERLPAGRLPKGHILVAPDLAVEVVSPNDLYSEVRVKISEYLEAGVRLAWAIDPGSRSAEVYRTDGSYSWLSEDDELDGESVLPGFRCRIGDVLPPAPEVES
jgi:Uma2 family endonuclease